eukprot:scaffold62876_cov20-Tisochrysis_lutea.AAC.8
MAQQWLNNGPTSALARHGRHLQAQGRTFLTSAHDLSTSHQGQPFMRVTQQPEHLFFIVVFMSR